ncbi:MAG: ATP-binding cassette domain-containing protein [Clostridia bacterium]|nr:ATP-binding cassette domain-containing protein [Clostridia bacterium]
MIRLSHVYAGYPEKDVLRDVSIPFPERGAVALMAPSGFGKTTLLKVLAGLLPIQKGEISGLENKKIAFLFQEDRLLPWLTAEKNVEIVSGKDKAAHWLKEMEIEDAARLPHDMSGGMRRRVALARALSYEGEVLLLDEPFKGLDEALRERIAARVKNAAPLTVLSVHDPVEAALMDASIIRLDQLQGS